MSAIFFYLGVNIINSKLSFSATLLSFKMVRVMVERQGEQEKNCSKLRNLQQKINDVINEFVTVTNCCQSENDNSCLIK